MQMSKNHNIRNFKSSKFGKVKSVVAIVKKFIEKGIIKKQV